MPSLSGRLRLTFLAAIMTLSAVIAAAALVLPAPACWWVGGVGALVALLSLAGMRWFEAEMLARTKAAGLALSALAAGRLDTRLPVAAAGHELAPVLAAAEALRPVLARAALCAAAMDASPLPLLLCDERSVSGNPAAHRLCGGALEPVAAACREIRAPGEARLVVNGMTLQVRAAVAAGGAGTAYALQDLTADLLLAEEMNSVGAAAARGDMSGRLALAGLSGTDLAVADMVNHLLACVAAACDDFAAQVEGLATGDLTRRIDGNYEGVFNKLKNDFNGTVIKLSTIMRAIERSSETLAHVAVEVSHASVELSERSEKHAASMEEAAAALEELTATVRQNSANSRQADMLAGQARDIATASGGVVAEAVSAMGRIQASSQKIEAIVGMIDEIAFQTNLLALNAAVEAARAGDSGKGFAVVATEVRNLAQRTALASREIKTLIAESSREVEVGSGHVGDAGEALRRITGSVLQVAAIIGEIATATAEQSTGIEQVRQTIGDVDDDTQRNAALVEEQAATARTLAEEATTLKGQMAFFLIDPAQAKGLARHAALVLGTKIDHTTFRDTVLDALAGHADLTADKLSDHHACRLGKWYDGIDEARVRNSRWFAALQDPHQRVHEAGKRALACRAAGDRAGAERAASDLNRASSEVLGVLDRLALDLRTTEAAR